MKVEAINNIYGAIRLAQAEVGKAEDFFTGESGFTKEQIELFEDIQKCRSELGRLFLKHHDTLKVRS